MEVMYNVFGGFLYWGSFGVCFCDWLFILDGFIERGDCVEVCCCFVCMIVCICVIVIKDLFFVVVFVFGIWV